MAGNSYEEFILDKEAQDSVGQENTPLTMASVLSQPYNINPLLLESISSEEEVIKWVWEGFIARGHKTLISALWKSGKSTFIASFLKSLETSQAFCGKPTTNIRTLVISEESKGEWARRRDEFQIKAEQFIWVMPRQVLTKMSHRDWASFLKEVSRYCVENEIGLVVIDTLSAFWPISDENNATDVQSALVPLNQLLGENIAVLLVHHHRKGGGDQGQAARGSGALGSDVDILIDFERIAGDPSSTQRKLTCLSRFDETPRELVIEYNNGLYTALGTLVDIAKEEKHRAILTILKDFREGASADTILSSWDVDDFGKAPSRRTIQRYLKELTESGKVTVQPSTQQNVADLYFLSTFRATRQTTMYRDDAPNPQDKTDEKPKIADLSHEGLKPEEVMEVFKNA